MTCRWEATAVSGAPWATWPWVMWCDGLSLRCWWPMVRLQWRGLAGAAVMPWQSPPPPSHTDSHTPYLFPGSLHRDPSISGICGPGILYYLTKYLTGEYTQRLLCTIGLSNYLCRSRVICVLGNFKGCLFKVRMITSPKIAEMFYLRGHIFVGVHAYFSSCLR